MKIVAATREQEPILAGMLELYAEDFRAFHPIEIGPEGRFVYRNLPLYWTEAGRHPLLVQVEDEWVGLALVKLGSELTGNEDVWDMAEFFVRREFRRRGLGKAIAHAVWRLYAGAWEVRCMEANAGALSFWEATVSSFAGCTNPQVRVEEDGRCWRIFSFTTWLL